MLAGAGIADVIMAPAADMFEMGVEVQVLRRGTMFAVRGRKLYDLYRAYPSLEAIPAEERQRVEKHRHEKQRAKSIGVSVPRAGAGRIRSSDDV